MNQTLARPLGERVARLEALIETIAADMEKLLALSARIEGCISSITHDASVDSRRLDEIGVKVDMLATTVAGIIDREKERTLAMKVGGWCGSALFAIGGTVTYLWSIRHEIGAFIRTNW